MKAGRELDALVAEKVMGYVWCLGNDGGPYAILCTRDYAEKWMAKFKDCVIGQPTNHARSDSLVPDYSTDISAAWEVVKKVWKAHFTLRLTPIGWVAGREKLTGHGGHEWKDPSKVASAPTAPLAICLAALKHA